MPHEQRRDELPDRPTLDFRSGANSSPSASSDTGCSGSASAAADRRSGHSVRSSRGEGAPVAASAAIAPCMLPVRSSARATVSGGTPRCSASSASRSPRIARRTSGRPRGDDRVALGVEPHRAVAEVRRADAQPLVVDDHQLGVHVDAGALGEPVHVRVVDVEAAVRSAARSSLISGCAARAWSPPRASRG